MKNRFVYIVNTVESVVITVTNYKDGVGKTTTVIYLMVPHRSYTQGNQLRAMLIENANPIFKAEIPRLFAFEKVAAKGIPVHDVKDKPAAYV